MARKEEFLIDLNKTFPKESKGYQSCMGSVVWSDLREKVAVGRAS
jgi:hypothetical protein